LAPRWREVYWTVKFGEARGESADSLPCEINKEIGDIQAKRAVPGSLSCILDPSHAGHFLSECGMNFLSSLLLGIDALSIDGAFDSDFHQKGGGPLLSLCGSA
jgi:hypothetical protein